MDGHDRFVLVRARAMVGSESERNATSSFQCLRCVVIKYIYNVGFFVYDDAFLRCLRGYFLLPCIDSIYSPFPQISSYHSHISFLIMTTRMSFNTI